MENRLDLIARRPGSKTDASGAPETITTPKLEQVTLPPAPKTDELPPPPTMPQPTAAPKKAETETPAAPPATRPREVEQPKKKGKKGTDEP